MLRVYWTQYLLLIRTSTFFCIAASVLKLAVAFGFVVLMDLITGGFKHIDNEIIYYVVGVGVFSLYGIIYTMSTGIHGSVVQLYYGFSGTESGDFERDALLFLDALDHEIAFLLMYIGETLILWSNYHDAGNSHVNFRILCVFFFNDTATTEIYTIVRSHWRAEKFRKFIDAVDLIARKTHYQ